MELHTPDVHAGLSQARRIHYPGIPWQRCQRHFLMNALEKAPKAREEELHRRLRRIRDESKSCLRLSSALLKEWHEDWITGRRYLRMEELMPRSAAAEPSRS